MSEGSPSRRRWLIFGAAAVFVAVADQASKRWIAANFSGPPTNVLGDLVRITVSHNTGGIFGLFGGSASLLALASAAVIVVIVLYQRRVAFEGPWLLSLALGLLLGGAIGNFIDRLRLGYVLDFVDMGTGSARFYTFNVADSAISTAIVLLLAIGLLGPRLPERLR